MKGTARMHRMYPNLCDMIYNPAFHSKVNTKVNNAVMNFWNLVGARERMPYKHSCEICHTPLRSRNSNRKYMVCRNCIQRYIREVRVGVRVPKLYVKLIAVESE